MPLYEYFCDKCDIGIERFARMSESDNPAICDCGGKAERNISIPALLGTRDNFGINKEFVDKKSGKRIDNWKSWEKAGYRDPMDTPEFKDIRNEIKRKKEKILKYDTRKKIHIKV